MVPQVYKRQHSSAKNAEVSEVLPTPDSDEFSTLAPTVSESSISSMSDNEEMVGVETPLTQAWVTTFLSERLPSFDKIRANARQYIYEATSNITLLIISILITYL
jgi:hypothetical protein